MPPRNLTSNANEYTALVTECKAIVAEYKEVVALMRKVGDRAKIAMWLLVGLLTYFLFKVDQQETKKYRLRMSRHETRD